MEKICTLLCRDLTKILSVIPQSNIVYTNMYIKDCSCVDSVVVKHLHTIYLIQNSPAAKKVCNVQECCCEKDVKSKVMAKKWLWWY